MKTILVQMAALPWTMQATHLACAMARNTHCSVVLLHLIQVRTPYLLGTNMSASSPSDEAQKAILEYAMIAEDYGVEMSLQPMHYENLSEAIIQAVVDLHAATLFACLPKTHLLFWDKFQLWNMRRQVTAQHCQLFTLETSEYVPMNPIHIHVSAQRQ